MSRVKAHVPIIIIVLLFIVGTGILLKKNLSPVQTNPEVMSNPTQSETFVDTEKSERVVQTTPSEIALSLTSHTNGGVVTSPNITLRGKTVPRAEVFVNDSQTIADSQGNFSVNLTLDEGENPVIVVANDEAGNSGELELIIYYDSGN